MRGSVFRRTGQPVRVPGANPHAMLAVGLVFEPFLERPRCCDGGDMIGKHGVLFSSRPAVRRIVRVYMSAFRYFLYHPFGAFPS